MAKNKHLSRTMAVKGTRIMGIESPDIIRLQDLPRHSGLFGFNELLQLFLALPIVMSLNCNETGTTPVTIAIKTRIDLQYDVVRFKVKPGSKVTITLINTSDMSHNLLIIKPGTRLDVVKAAIKLAEKGPQMDYIPDIAEVLWSIPLVSPGQTKSIMFKAPLQTGVYPYVCTYPGHGFVMYGAIYVTLDSTLPDARNDLNIPESRRLDDTSGRVAAQIQMPPGSSPHPYALIAPYLYQVYIEGATPNAIAVHLPNDLSYCWDAGDCRLRFAWKGGFLDMSDLWKGHFNASAKILGDIFFRDNTDYPIRLGEAATIPTIKYKGFRLIEKYPEFHYTLNGIDVYELVRQKADSNGLVRTFRIPHAGQKIWFFTNPQDDAIEYEFSAGHLKDKKLELTPVEAKEFTITMTSYYVAYKNE